MAPQSIDIHSVHQAGDVTPSLPIGYDKQNDKRVGQSSQVITLRRNQTYDPLIKSPKSQHSDAMELTFGQQEHTGEAECQQMTNSLENKGYSASSIENESEPGVQGRQAARRSAVQQRVLQGRR